MRNSLIAVMINIIFLLVGCRRGGMTPLRNPDGLHREIGESTVALLENSSPGEFSVYCTGVWVSDELIVTAGHCVASNEEGENNPVGGKIYYTVDREVHEVGKDPAGVHLGKVVVFDEKHDLALIRVDNRGVPIHGVVSLAKEMPGIGERVYMVGHPKGMYWTFVEGVVSGYRDESDIGKVVQVNGSIWFGNSGGGAFDIDGNLVGICSRLTKVPQINLYVHIDLVKEMLKEYNK